jgi:hypothetical protein
MMNMHGSHGTMHGTHARARMAGWPHAAPWTSEQAPGGQQRKTQNTQCVTIKCLATPFRPSAATRAGHIISSQLFRQELLHGVRTPNET